MTNDLEIPIDAPPATEDFGEEEERWAVAFAFLGQISQPAIDEVLKREHSTAHVVDHKNQGVESLVFGFKGMRDVVVSDAVETVRPLIGEIITNKLLRVTVISHKDAFQAIREGQSYGGFDVTQIVKGHLNF